MIFSTLVVSALLASALALPSSKERFDARVARRAEGAHLSHPRTGAGTDTTASAPQEYSPYWAGGVLHGAAGTWKSASATFTVPTPQEPPGASGKHSASVWVGIDGDSCGTAILQTGIDMYVNGSSVSYDAWYEWFPDYAHDFTGITIHAGDSITASVTASSATAGVALLTNHNTGQTVAEILSSGAALCMQDAEWIVEDYLSAGAQVPFADFGVVEFTNASATDAAGAQVGPAGASEINIVQNGVVLTSVQLGASTVTVTYL